jgi:two-component system nitrate/nitrite response regulator NarL
MRQARVLIAGSDRFRARAELRVAVEQNRGFSVCAEVADGAAAVEAALREQPDLCLLDVEMPGGGIAPTREITARLPATKVVILAASLEDDDELFGALSAGAMGYLVTESLDAAGLRRALKAVLRGEAVIPRTLATRLVGEFRDRGPRRRVVLTETGHDLTSREWEVLHLLREGLSTGDIAKRLFVSHATVRSHVSAVLRKLRLPDRESVRMLGEG